MEADTVDRVVVIPNLTTTTNPVTATIVLATTISALAKLKIGLIIITTVPAITTTNLVTTTFVQATTTTMEVVEGDTVVKGVATTNLAVTTTTV